MWPVGHEDCHFILHSPHFDLIVIIRMCPAQHYFSSFKELKLFFFVTAHKGSKRFVVLGWYVHDTSTNRYQGGTV